MLTTAFILTASGVLGALLAALLVYIVGVVLAHFGVPVERTLLGLICLVVFVLVLLGDSGLVIN